MIVPIKNIDSIKGRFRDKYIPDAISLKFDIGDKVKIVHAGIRYTSLNSALRYFNITRDQLYCREKKKEYCSRTTMEKVILFKTLPSFVFQIQHQFI